MKYFILSFLCLSSCTTLDQSIRLGATSGALTGAAAVYSGQNMSGRPPTSEEAFSAITLGAGLGIIMSYFVHQQVTSDREDAARQTEIYFGDLPPSPFVIPGRSRRGGR